MITTSFQTVDLVTALPEVILAAGVLALLLLGVLKDKSGGLINWLSVLLLFGVCIALGLTGDSRELAFNDLYVTDHYARFMKALALFGAASAILMSAHFIQSEKFERFEFPILVLLATLGMMLMVSANDLISLYVGLELLALPLYVIAVINRQSVHSAKMGLKYFILGIISSCLLLYGCSLVYGFTGVTGFDDISSFLNKSGGNLGVSLGLGFIIAGLAFKISAVPFHAVTPGLYQRVPTPITAFFTAAPKVATMAVTIRVLVGSFSAMTDQWQYIIVFLSLASMLVGTIACLRQTNIKLLMAYSSIGHMGFALVGLSAATEQGIKGVIIYLALYLFMFIGVFCCILAMRTRHSTIVDIDDLAGLAKNNGMMALVLAMFMLSLAGVTPLAGFFAKFYVLSAAIQAELYTLAVIGVLATIAGAYAYLRIVKIIYFDEPDHKFIPMPRTVKLLLTISSIIVICYVLYPAPLVDVATISAKSLF